MGCDFIFYNETLNRKIVDSNLPAILSININRYGNKHLMNVIINIIKKEKWNITDIVCIESCCSEYKYNNGKLTDVNYPEWIYIEDKCEYKNCSICK